jgi:hypothetical protein
MVLRIEINPKGEQGADDIKRWGSEKSITLLLY